jgi:hypothetical protein
MDNKFNNMLQDFLKNNNVENIDEANEKLQEFIKMYNSGEIEYKNTPLDDAYEILEEAQHAKNEKEAIRLAKKAYEKSAECFDALLFQCDLEENGIKRMKLLNDGLEFEKNRLTKENYFDKENIGHFYGIFETRPYIRGLVTKIEYLLEEGKLRQACNICNEVLKLNNNDNLGARYLLMAIYGVLEEEKEMLKLYKKYPEENLEMLFPLFAIYYKNGNDKKALEYLNRIDKCNSNFVKFFKGTIKESKKVNPGYYSRGDSSEIFMYLERYDYLLITMPRLHEYIIENLMKNKKAKR